jgi:hypothetical protein
VLRELIFELQAFPQRINETSMVGSYSSVDLNDMVLTMSRDSGFHGTPPLIAAARLNEDRMFGSVPYDLESMPILVANARFIW